MLLHMLFKINYRLNVLLSVIKIMDAKWGEKCIVFLFVSFVLYKMSLILLK